MTIIKSDVGFEHASAHPTVSKTPKWVFGRLEGESEQRMGNFVPGSTLHVLVGWLPYAGKTKAYLMPMQLAEKICFQGAKDHRCS